jgi:hypothetical protein
MSVPRIRKGMDATFIAVTWNSRVLNNTLSYLDIVFHLWLMLITTSCTSLINGVHVFFIMEKEFRLLLSLIGYSFS